MTSERKFEIPKVIYYVLNDYKIEDYYTVSNVLDTFFFDFDKAMEYLNTKEYTFEESVFTLYSLDLQTRFIEKRLEHKITNPYKESENA